MRIGLYGMPAAGKTHILERIDFMEVIFGSKFLREYDPDFDSRDEAGREKSRKGMARLLKKKEAFIVDGHYAFGDETAFTDDDGELYDVFLYLYISPDILYRYDAIDINMYDSNIFHTKMMVKEIDLQNYLFKTDDYELPPQKRLEIMDNLRREMIEIYSGRNIY